MKRIILYILAAISLTLSAKVTDTPHQKADCGSIDRFYIYSEEMGDTMVIDVWQPSRLGYFLFSNDDPVVYMHDGQNLFDSSTTWNQQSWEVDSVMCAMQKNSEIPQAYIVGIHSSSETRVGDLMPVKAVTGQGMEETLKSVGMDTVHPRGDKYLSFIVKTLKPFIDYYYKPKSDRDNTFIAGSSMGGLMSVYALCEYPDVFGGALCLSTHWIGTPELNRTFSDAMERYIETHLPAPQTHKLYFDHGTETIDAYYGPAEMRIVEMLRKNGYNENNLVNKVFEGDAHEENAWKRRIGPALKFILRKK